MCYKFDTIGTNNTKRTEQQITDDEIKQTFAKSSISPLTKWVKGVRQDMVTTGL